MTISQGEVDQIQKVSVMLHNADVSMLLINGEIKEVSVRYGKWLEGEHNVVFRPDDNLSVDVLGIHAGAVHAIVKAVKELEAEKLIKPIE